MFRASARRYDLMNSLMTSACTTPARRGRPTDHRSPDGPALDLATGHGDLCPGAGELHHPRVIGADFSLDARGRGATRCTARRGAPDPA